MKGILGTKLGMLQIWNEDGKRIGVTALHAGPCSVLQIKNKDRDGYSAIQIGFDACKEKHITKPEKGHQKVSFEKNNTYYSNLLELRDYTGEAQVGDLIKCEIFAAGEKVMISAVAKGKGFQGVIKRHGFGGGRATHGFTTHRETGSVGAGNDPGRIHLGKKMPGRMGGKKITVRNLKIFRIVPEDNLILIEGSVPGPNGASVLVYQK
ncbi:MAG: 50S ribosomal protein L3 [Spirochaetia bacterium]|nr:50S ribosomal protein L3 [Spirochaetia bacterium]